MTDDIDILSLSDGITIVFKDLTNRYFGDFNRVYIDVEVRIETRLIEQKTDLLSLLDDNQTSVSYKTSLEQMGVTTASIAEVRSSLIKDFVTNTQIYLKKPAFIENLIRKKRYQRSSK